MRRLRQASTGDEASRQDKTETEAIRAQERHINMAVFEALMSIDQTTDRSIVAAAPAWEQAMRCLRLTGWAAALALAACTSDAPPPARSTASAPPPPISSAATTSPPGHSATTTASSSPSPQPDLELPSGTPVLVDGPAEMAAIEAGVLTPLVPAGSIPTGSTVLAAPDGPIDQIAVAWRGGDTPPGRAGLIVWQRGDAAWHAVYAFTDPKRDGVFGVRLDQADATHDGLPDLLTFEDVGGSGACGTYRVVASVVGDATEIFRRDVCDTQIQIAGGHLRIREAVFSPSDPHCCPSAFRTTILRWKGNRWERVSSEVSPVPGSS